MTVFVILLLILLGIVLLLLEFLVVPGITIAGIGGVLLLVGGIFLSYHSYGIQTGHYTLIGTLLFTGMVLMLALKSKTWKKLMLDAQIDSKVEKFEEDKIKEGDEGVALTRLAPMGTVSINNIVLEGKSIGPFIDEKTSVVVVKVVNKIVIVKPKNDN
ncbi:MAG: NfeD family protein [Marinifilaceae bacterium]|jgi:membrane-bound ClpP family serine protease